MPSIINKTGRLYHVDWIEYGRSLLFESHCQLLSCYYYRSIPHELDSILHVIDMGDGPELYQNWASGNEISSSPTSPE